jgi:hypothetical protein
MVDIFDLACELLPPGTKELYLCLLPLYLLSHLPPSLLSKYSIYQTEWLLGGGGGAC